MSVLGEERIPPCTENTNHQQINNVGLWQSAAGWPREMNVGVFLKGMTR